MLMVMSVRFIRRNKKAFSELKTLLTPIAEGNDLYSSLRVFQV